MRKHNIKQSVRFFLVFVILAFSSCTDWLTVSPEDKLIKGKFWKKTSDVNSALAATYDAIRDASMKSLIFGELRADLVTFPGSSFTDYAKIASSDISPTNGVVSWKSYYTAINLANTLMYFDKVVYGLDKTFTKKMMDGVDAEALFIRSLSYFYLVRIWKDVPLVLEPSISDTSSLYLPTSSEYIVINQIIEDLLKAKDIAYTNEFRGSDYFYGRANKFSIMALLADVYLWNQQYQKCIDYCDSVSIQGGYQLEPSDTWFNIYYPGNSINESIIEIQYDDNLQQNNPIYDNLMSVSGGTQLAMNTKNIGLLLDKEDLRNYSTKYGVWKYRGKDGLGLESRTINERDANWIIYRYADIMLMKAEACTELNRFDDANALITETMLRAGMPHEVASDKEILRKAVLDERGREFLLEGKRWFDLLRAAKRNNFENKQLIINMILSGAGIQQQAILRTKVYDTLSYYLPIAEHELIYNQNLKQNPFYDR